MFALDCTRGGNWMYDKYEDFSEAQVKILNLYVTNTDSNIFALHNLPEVIKGALFSRYSRSSLGLRSLLLKEFILNEETAFKAISRTNGTGGEEAEIEDQIMAVKKAQNFYDRILDGYGDDSIGELGGAHLALENISMLAAKIIEDCRIGGSPLEKSTRYIYFDQKLGGEYLFHRESILMTSAFRDLYTSTCNSLFETYSQLIAPLTELMEKKFPKEHDISKVAYTAALRAKVLDCLRGLLPASALTNMGLYGNGRFFENLIQKLHAHNLVEMQETGKKSYTELAKIIPSFIRRSEPSNKYQQSFANYQEQMQGDLKMLAKKYTSVVPKMEHSKVELIGYDPDAPYKIAGALLFAESHGSLYEIQKQCKRLSSEELSLILDSACTFRENRRHKSPRALEHAYFTFEIVADFGIYRDLQRHRVLTQERQLLTCNYGYFVPQEIIGTEMENKYREAMQEAKKTYDLIAQELPEEAQYVVPMAYNIHWYFHVNLRQLQWICELRSSPAGHPAYRYIAQEMAKQVSTAFPMLERFFKFVDYDGYELGRLGQEIRTAEKMKARGHIL
jgi:thymidylate synthase ThyX